MQVFLQRFPLNKIHHQVPMLRVSEVLMDTWQVRVLQAGQQEHLAVKGIGRLNHFSWLQSTQVDLLDCDNTILGESIHCLVNGSKATCPDLSKDAVAFPQKRFAIGS